MALKWVLADDSKDKIEQGKIVINGNTTFNGDATIVSSGEDETTIIKGGSITFSRGGVPITVIRNMKMGEIYTDGNGIGKITLNNFLNTKILTSIKSFNVSEKIRSLNAYASLDDSTTNTWSFYLYGTESSISEPISNNISFSTWTHTFNLSYLMLSHITLRMAISATGGHLWDRDDIGDNTLRGSGTFRCRLKCNRTNDNGSKVIGDTYINLPVKFKYAYGGSRGQIYMPTNIFEATIQLNDKIEHLSDTVIKIEISDESVSYSGTFTRCGWDSCWTEPMSFDSNRNGTTCTANDDPSTANLIIESINGEIVYNTEDIVNVTGGGEIQYIAMEGV